MPRKLGPEAALMRLCRDWLDAEHIPYWRMQSGATVGTYKGKSRFIRFGERGMADLLIAPNLPCDAPMDPWVCRELHRGYVWAELKSEDGRLSPAQQEFQAYVLGLGMQYAIIRSLEDLQAALQG